MKIIDNIMSKIGFFRCSRLDITQTVGKRLDEHRELVERLLGVASVLVGVFCVASMVWAAEHDDYVLLFLITACLVYACAFFIYFEQDESETE